MKNKDAITRYFEIDRCLRDTKHHYNVGDITDKCSDAIAPSFKSISERQIRNDLKHMVKYFGAPIIKYRFEAKICYKYSSPNFHIAGLPDDARQNRIMMELLEAINSICSLPGIGDVIKHHASQLRNICITSDRFPNIVMYKGETQLRGIEYFGISYSHIISCSVLNINYCSFMGKSHDFVMHPYMLVNADNRWYLIGRNHKTKSIITLALDRMNSVEDNVCTGYIMSNVDWKAYFDDVIGISVVPDINTECVLLRVTNKQMRYFESKPIHHSQRTVICDREHTTISINVKPNYELERMILAHIDEVVVLKPESLRSKIIERVSKGMLCWYDYVK